jgi:predicted ATPase with chaperone activity
MTARGIMARSATEAARVPPLPRSIEETGLSRETIIDLALKTLYVGGARTGRELADQICILFTLLDELLLDLQHRQWLEVRGTRGHGRDGFVFDLTVQGRARAREAVDANHYVGPLPVPFETYRQWVDAQTVRHVRVGLEEIGQHFGHLVLDDDMIERLGPAINSAKSIFLYGHTGNGKTVIAEAIAEMIGGGIYVPYATEIERQIVVIYDPVYHREVEAPSATGGPTWLEPPPEHDPRFAHVKRPVVFAGGELTLAELDLRYDADTKFYQAPFQMKANGGVLIIDDLGRQLVDTRDLLNRWIVPLEKRVDYLTLHTGHKFPTPFDVLIVFATNLAPADLVDEAFLRRIHYKIHVSSPVRAQYEHIFQRCCEERGLAYDPEAVALVFRRYYEERGIAPRSCHPRDIVDHMIDLSRFRNLEPTLDLDLMDRACSTYFLDPEGPSEGDWP